MDTNNKLNFNCEYVFKFTERYATKDMQQIQHINCIKNRQQVGLYSVLFDGDDTERKKII